MALPKYDELQLPALTLLADGKPRTSRDFIEPLAQQFSLSKEETEIAYDSGNKQVFFDRICWALSYLNMAGLVSKPKRGVFQINQEGRQLLNSPLQLKSYISTKVRARESVKKQKKNVKEPLHFEEEKLTPEEALFDSYQGIKASIYREILDTILIKSPREFEKLVVQLLQAMGYGGEIVDSGKVTQYTNDKGIDGVIKEDILGFGRIHIQAKRYKFENHISREDIQKFVGALAVAQSDKGVFITTSDFTRGAYEYVNSLNTNSKIVLINGEQLAAYIYKFNVGMQIEKVLEIKKLDSDFWDMMEDE